MSEISTQLEAVIRDIETLTPHTERCEEIGGWACDPNCKRAERVRLEIARTVERMINAAMEAYQSASFANQMAWLDGDDDKQQDADAIGWAAALRSASPETETK